VILSLGVFETHGSLMLAIILGLVIGKPVGIVLSAWLAVRSGIAVKPPEYSWRQLCGAGALAGIGFTMSLFIAGEAYPPFEKGLPKYVRLRNAAVRRKTRGDFKP